MSRLPPQPPSEPSQPSGSGATPEPGFAEPPRDALDALLRQWHREPESSLDAGRSRLLEALSREPLSTPKPSDQAAESPVVHTSSPRSAAPLPGRRWWTRRPVHALGAAAALALVASLALLIARPHVPASPSILTEATAKRDEARSAKTMSRGVASAPPLPGRAEVSAAADALAFDPVPHEFTEQQVARAQQVLSPTLQKIAMTQTQNAVVLVAPPAIATGSETADNDRAAVSKSPAGKSERADPGERSKSYGANQQASSAENTRARRTLPLAITVAKFDVPTQNLLTLNGALNLRQVGTSNIIQGDAFEDSLLSLATLDVVSRIEELPVSATIQTPPTATPAAAAPAAPAASGAPAAKPADASGEKQPKKK